MPETDTCNAVTASSDDVEVTKRAVEDEFAVPVIAFEINSNRTDPVRVRIVDPVPEEVSVEDLGFHGYEGIDHWTVESDRVVFHSELTPGESYTTRYGVRSQDGVERFLREPFSVEVSPREESAFAAPGDDAPADDAAPDGPHDPADDWLDWDAVAVEGTEPGADDEHPRGAVDDGEAVEDPGRGVVAELVDELREGTVSDERLDFLRAELGQGAAEGPTEARIRRLQREVADLLAYTDALESFLGEHGSAERIIADFEDHLDELATELDDVSETVDAREMELAAVDREVETVRETATSNGEELDRLATEFSTATDRLADVEDQVTEEDVVGRIADVEEEFDALREWQSRLQNAVLQPNSSADAGGLRSD